MAVKTIELDDDAYELLSRRRKGTKTFSEVVKEHFERRPTGQDLLDILPELTLSEETLDAIEDLVRARRHDPARPVDL